MSLVFPEVLIIPPCGELGTECLENSFVLEALRDALGFMADCGLGVPDICNSDQGSHFTSTAYVGLLEQAGTAISMDGRGRCLDTTAINLSPNSKTCVTM